MVALAPADLKTSTMPRVTGSAREVQDALRAARCCRRLLGVVARRPPLAATRCHPSLLFSCTRCPLPPSFFCTRCLPPSLKLLPFLLHFCPVLHPLSPTPLTEGGRGAARAKAEREGGQSARKREGGQKVPKQRRGQGVRKMKVRKGKASAGKRGGKGITGAGKRGG